MSPAFTMCPMHKKHFFLTFLWACCGAWWLGLCPPAQAAGLTLRDMPSIDLTGYVGFLRDPSVHAVVEDVAAGKVGAFTPARERLLEGFTSDAIWLRLSLQRPAAVPGEWWLLLENAFLEDVRLYVPGPNGQFVERRAGTNYGRSQRDVDHAHLMFRLNLEVDQRVTIYVRIVSRTSVATSLRLWQPSALVRASTVETLVWGAYYGMYLLNGLFYLYLWSITRKQVHGWYSLYVGTMLVGTMLDKGWLQMALPDTLQSLSSPMIWIAICLGTFFLQMFNANYLELARKLPRARHMYVAVTGISVTAALLAIAMGYPQVGMQIIQPMALVLVMWAMLLALLLAARGSRKGRFFLFAFSIFYVGMVLRFARNLGWIDLGLVSSYGYQIGIGLHMLVLSVGLFMEYQKQRRKQEVLMAQAQAEQRQMEDQRGFMAMISHEFRTPLGVIGASTENLLRSPRLDQKDRTRCAKILRANERLTVLMDTYLSVERLESADTDLHTAPVNLVALCRRVVDDFEGTDGPSIELTYDADPLMCRCDEGLLRIALSNLVHNARRHSPTDQPVILRVENNGSEVLLLVKDKGNGISPDELPLIFKRYFRGRGAVQKPGAGLGLFLVEKVAHRHGGKVTVHTSTDHGCEFCMHIPKR